MLDNYPLQVYESGLVFSPSDSLVRKKYAKMAPAWATLTLHPEKDWPTHLTSFHKDHGSPTAAAYSNDGNRIAISLCEGDLLVYDVITGSLCQRGKGPKCGAITAVASDIAMAYDDTNSSILIFYTSNIMETRLARWDLQTLQFEDIKRFPSRSNLSPNAKYASSCKGTGVSLYDIEADETFLLPSAAASVGYDAPSGFSYWDPEIQPSHWYSPTSETNDQPPSDSSSPPFTNASEIVIFSSSSYKPSLNPCHVFSADGHGLAVQWIDGLIEVWNISERSVTRTFQEPQISHGKNMALSRENKILAIIEERPRTSDDDNGDYWICGRVTSFNHRIKALSVETGALLWQINFNIGNCPISISFSKHDLVLYSEFVGRFDLTDARTGMPLGVIPEGGISFSRTALFGQQAAIVDSDTIRLHDCGQLRAIDSRSFHIVTLLQNQLYILATDGSIEWFECLDFDTSEVLWRGPPSRSKEFNYGRHCVSSSYIAMAQEGIVAVFHRNGHLFESHSSFPITGDVRLNFSPHGTRLVCHANDFVIVYDVETHITHTTTFAHGYLYHSKPLWSNDYQRMLIDLEEQSRVLYWSHDSGFEELEIETSKYARHSLSPSGRIFACLTDVGTREFQLPVPMPSGLDFHDIQPHRLRIWNLDNKEVMSTTTIRLFKDAPILLRFMPCETRVLVIENNKLHIYSISGELLSLLQSGIPTYLLRGDLAFDSDDALRTPLGILRIPKDIRKGNKLEPFIDNQWIYHDDRKVLWLPLDYSKTWEKYYSHGRYAFRHSNDNTALLRLDFGRKL